MSQLFGSDITLPRDPTEPLQATTKQYVDAIATNVRQVEMEIGLLLAQSNIPSDWCTIKMNLLRSNEYIRVLAYSPELDLFVGGGSVGTMTYSKDGVIWRTVSRIGTSAIYKILWVPEKSFFLCCNWSGELAISYDGKAWTVVHKYSSPGVLCWSPDLKLFLVTGFNSFLLSSTDGINWSSRSTTGTFFSYQYPMDMIWDSVNKRFLGVGGYVNSGNNEMAQSPDGTAWVRSVYSGIAYSMIYSVGYSPTLNRYAVGSSYAEISLSNDAAGNSWTKRGNYKDSSSNGLYTMRWYTGLNCFMTGAARDGRLFVSTDGTNWPAKVTPFTATGGIYDTAYSPQSKVFVIGGAAGSGGMIATRKLNNVSELVNA